MDYSRASDRELQLPARLPLVAVLDNRQEEADRDARLVNGFVEVGPAGRFEVVKRPGIVEVYNIGGTAFGMFGRDVLYSVWLQGSGVGATAKLYNNGVFVSNVNKAREYRGAEAILGADTRYWLMHNETGFYYVDESNVLTGILFDTDTAGPLTCGITNGSTNVTHSSSTIPQVYYEVSGTGIPANTTVAAVVSNTQFTLSQAATATNASASLTFTAVSPPKNPRVVTNPPHLVPGVVQLNRATYVLAYNSKLVGSDPDSFTRWNELNFLYAYIEADLPVAIAKHLSHIVVFKESSTEFFRDAGNSPGSPLERVESLKLDVGLYDAGSLSQAGDTIVWLSRSSIGGRSVYLLRGLRAKEVATPAVRRTLSAYFDWIGYMFSMKGHDFYALTSAEAGITLVYDIGMDFWCYWAALGQTYMPFYTAVTKDDAVYFQHLTDGKIYKMSPEYLDDAGQPIVMDIYAPEFDGGFRVAKYLPKMYFIGDQEAGSRLKVRSNDSNREPQRWSNWREVDLGKPRPVLRDCGSFYKRAWHFRHELPTRCRLMAVELDLQPGVL